MERFATVLEKIFRVVFFVFSLALVVCSIHGGGGFDHNVHWIISCIIIMLFFISVVYHAINLPKKLSGGGIEGYINAVEIFALSLCAHLLIVWAVGSYTEQVSDFATALDFSKYNFPLTDTQDWYRIMSNWAIQPLYLKLIQELFGYGRFTGIIFNAILSAFSSTFIYLLCYLSFKNENLGYLAAYIYTFWPSHLLYTVILSPEFPNIFLTLLFFLLIEISIRQYKRKTVYMTTGLSAVVLSLSGFFKSIDKIILVALGIMLVLFAFKTTYLKTLNEKKGNQEYAKKILLLVFFISSYLLSNKLIFIGLDYAYGSVVNRNPAMHFIYIGLNPETYGTWNEESADVYRQNVINCDYNYERASDLTLEQLKHQIREKGYLTPAYFEKKFETAWKDNAETFWVNETITDESPFLRKPNWFYAINMLTQNFWIMICICVCVEAVSLLFRSDSWNMFICLILFGFACLMVLSEVQCRYKCVMYPIISVLAADGIMYLIGVLKYIYQKGKRFMRSIISGSDSV